MNRLLEFHDSTLSEIVLEGEQVKLGFQEGYVQHSKGVPGKDPGEGWIQYVELRFEGANILTPDISLPVTLWDGTFSAGTQQFNGGVELPISYTGSCRLHLTTVSGENIVIESSSITSKEIGTGTYLDEFKA